MELEGRAIILEGYQSDSYREHAMGFDQKLKDLLRLQTTQPDAFTAELDEPWPGMRSDIELALGILVEYQRRGKPLRLIEDFQINEETGEVKVLMPEWQTSLIAEFRSLFDEDEAQYRFMKTYNELIGKRMTGPGLN
jgi:hypothetical protein